MMYKSNLNQANPQQLIAGIIKEDANIEFFGIRKTKQVKFMQHGKTHDFNELKGVEMRAVVEAFEADAPAKDILKSLTDTNEKPLNLNYSRKLELYIYCVLQDSENFRDSTDCISLNFKRKKLILNGHVLKPREIVMIDLFSKDYKDSIVAQELGIATSTFNQHKKEFFTNTGFQTKTGLMIAATQQKLVV